MTRRPRGLLYLTLCSRHHLCDLLQTWEVQIPPPRSPAFIPSSLRVLLDSCNQRPYLRGLDRFCSTINPASPRTSIGPERSKHQGF